MNDEPRRLSALADALLCGWFLLVTVAFWGPYLAIYFPDQLRGLYALFLLGGIVAATLRFLKKRTAAEDSADAGKERVS